MKRKLWYDDSATHEDFWAWSDRVTQSAADRKARAEAALTVYFGAEFSFNGAPLDQLTALIDHGRMALEPVGYNLVASCTDTMAGHILRNKPRPLFVTDGGSVDQKRDAQGMQRAVEGEFHAAGIYGRLAQVICYMGLILDAGGVKCTPDIANERLDYQIVWPHEIFVPRTEETRGCVRQMVHQFDVDREVLLTAFPEHEKAIEEAPHGTVNEIYGDNEICDRVVVREAWHLPSGRVREGKPHDGVRILAIEGAILDRSEWRHSYFPIALFKPMPALGSYWSRGYPERLAGAQCKLNEYQDRIDSILNLHARPLLIAWQRAGLNRAKITNAVANILVSKVPPQQALWQMTPQAVPRELVERVQAIIAWGEKQAGISELSISANKPAGIEHAPALRHLADTEAVRHTLVFDAWEQIHQDLAEITVGGLRELAEAVDDYTTIFSDNKEITAVKWRDVDLGRDRYHLTRWPTDLLPQTPSAKIATLIEMVQNQMISPREALSRFENPDIKDLLGDQSAAQENVERILRDAQSGKPGASVPHAYLDLALLQIKAKERINRLESDGESPEIVDRLRVLYEAATKLQLSMTAQTNLASGAGGVAGVQSVANMGAPTAPAEPAAPAAAPPPGMPPV